MKIKSASLKEIVIDELTWTAAEQAALLNLNIHGIIGSHMGGYANRLRWFEKCKTAGFLDGNMKFTPEGQTFVSVIHLKMLEKN